VIVQFCSSFNIIELLKKIKITLVKYRNALRRYNAPNISKKTLFGPNVQIFGLDNICINDNCTIGENTLFTINDRSKKNIQLEIGRNTYIGRNNFFSVGKLIYVGEYGIFGNCCSFICSDHVFDNPLLPYSFSGNSYHKSIKIGVNCWLGHDVSIIGNVTIGHGCVIGAKTVITKDIPPFSMVIGNPARIIKSFNFNSSKWEAEVSLHDSIYYDEDTYLKFLRENFEVLPLSYHSSSSKYGDL